MSQDRERELVFKDAKPEPLPPTRVHMSLENKKRFCRAIKNGSIKRLSDCHHMHRKLYHRPMEKKTYQRLKVFF